MPPNIETGQKIEIGKSKEEEQDKRPKPQDDFYRYVNFERLKEPIPPDKARWGAYYRVAHETQLRLLNICEVPPGGEEEKERNVQQVRDFYRSGIDMDARNRIGIGEKRVEGEKSEKVREGIRPLLSEIEEIESSSDVFRFIARLHTEQINPFFSFTISRDFHEPGAYALIIYQRGLGMPNREYYLSEDELMKDKRAKYREYVSNIFGLLEGYTSDKADKAADSVFRVEHALAKASIPPEEMRVISNNYNRFTRGDAKRRFSNIEWDVYFDKLGLSDIQEFVVGQIPFLEKVGEIVKGWDMNDDNKNDIRNYMTFIVLNSTADMLSQDFESQNSWFYMQILQGTKKPKPLREVVIKNMIGTELVEAIAPMYCDLYFDESDKKRVKKIGDDIREEFGERLNGADWMTEELLSDQKKKLEKIEESIGFPDEWRDVSGIDIERDAYLENNLRLRRFNFRRRVDNLNRPYNNAEWLLSPLAVNASSNRRDRMTFPAAFLQAPFFDRNANDAYNYGAYGSTNGHELTHPFDDQGLIFDSEGKMRKSRSDNELKILNEKAEKFVKYFGSKKANGQDVNGKLTLAENIADVAGIDIALAAYLKRLKKDEPDAFDNDLIRKERVKMFFVGYTRTREEQVTPEEAEESSINDPHAPAEVRANAVLAIMSDFHWAYDVEEGKRMHVPLKDRPKLW